MQQINHWPDITELALPETLDQDLYHRLLEPFDSIGEAIHPHHFGTHRQHWTKRSMESNRVHADASRIHRAAEAGLSVNGSHSEWLRKWNISGGSTRVITQSVHTTTRPVSASLLIRMKRSHKTKSVWVIYYFCITRLNCITRLFGCVCWNSPSLRIKN